MRTFCLLKYLTFLVADISALSLALAADLDAILIYAIEIIILLLVIGSAEAVDRRMDLQSHE